MDPRVLKVVNDKMPRFNSVITEGFHQKEFENAVSIFERNLRLIFKNVERKGVYFKCVKRVPPKEFYAHLRGNSKKSYDIHKETMYPVCLYFEYRDASGEITPLKPTYVMLPYCDRYGDMFIRNTQYSLQFVLAERGLPVTKDNEIFIKVLGYKTKIGTEHFKYDRLYNETESHRQVPMNANLPANRFYTPTEQRRITSTKVPIPLLAWYVFANMGFSAAMALYGECEHCVGSTDAVAQTNHAKDRWEIYTTPTERNDKSLGGMGSEDIAIAVRNKNPKRQELSIMAQQYVCALLYVADCLPAYFDIREIDNPDYWKRIIGRCSIKTDEREEYLQRLMNDHFDSMNEYLDEDSIKKFAAQSIVVSNMFDLFNHIIANHGNLVQTTDRASMLHKEIASLEFTLDKLITAANQFKNEIKNNSELTKNKVEKLLGDNFRLKEIDNARSANLVQEATPTDCPYVDYMLGAMPQHKVYASGMKGRGSGDFNPNDAAGLTHASIPFVMSYQRITKPDPDGRGFFNPCLFLVNDKTTAIPPHQRQHYEEVERRLKYRETK